MKQKKRKNNKAAVALNLIGELLLIIVILACVPLTVPRIFGYEIYSVISGSMEPAIPTGSLVYIKSIEPAEVLENDVIAFYSPSNPEAIITHRVVKNQVVSGQFITKGDANAAEDVSPIPYECLLGKVELSIPYVGGLLAQVVTTQGKIMVAGVIAASVILQIVAGRLQKNTDHKKEKKQEKTGKVQES